MEYESVLNFATIQSVGFHEDSRDVSHGTSRKVPPAIRVIESEFPIL